MKITAAHLTFYTQKKLQKPSWAKELTLPTQCSVHRLINLQTFGGEIIDTEMHNTLELLKLKRKRGALLPYLRQLAASDMGGVKRRAMARRWVKRIEEELLK